MSEENKTNTISEATRRNIFDYLRAERVDWSGRLQETDFLSRLYDLETLPSSEYRSSSMLGDILRHRVNNPMDWDDDWVYSDERLNLLHCSEEVFLNFLCEMLHPIVRPDADEVKHLLSVFNEVLATEGWQIVEKGRMANRPVFAARRLIPGSSLTLGNVHKVTQILSAEYIAQQVNRMEAAIEDDPELAIGTAKEFVETICKTILVELGVKPSKNADLLVLVKQVRAKLDLLPESINDKVKGAATVKRLLSNLGATAQGLAELRGLYGTGHGKIAGSGLGVFLFETYQERTGRGSSNG